MTNMQLRRGPETGVRLIPIVVALILTGSGLTGVGAAQTRRESVLDRVIHLDDSVHLDVPDPPRWEAELGITGRRIAVGDAELYVEDEGGGIPLVLLHGGPGGTHHSFHPWFARAGGYARVIYYDQRGCGLSDWEPGEAGYSVDQAVEDLEALRGALGLTEWVLAGFSYGGLLAQYYATLHPERVAGLVLVGATPGLWTDLGPSREYDFITPAERARMDEVRTGLRVLRPEHGWSYQEFTRLLVYNGLLSGDWKRQRFYRPSQTDMARIARYGWVQDESFRPAVSSTQSAVDLEGAFERNPIPTLILEGKWDLTWGDRKATILSRNHPNARMIVIEEAAHSIYDENPEAFFTALRDFLADLPRVPPADRMRFAEQLAAWRLAREASLDHQVVSWDWGLRASRHLAAVYRRELLDDVRRLSTFQRVGFALYDVRGYDDALSVFRFLEEKAAIRNDLDWLSFSLIWQGHMLDLLGRRDEAMDRYRRVQALGHDDGWQHDQYGLQYRYLDHAAARLAAPFQRIENRKP